MKKNHTIKVNHATGHESFQSSGGWNDDRMRYMVPILGCVRVRMGKIHGISFLKNFRTMKTNCAYNGDCSRGPVFFPSSTKYLYARTFWGFAMSATTLRRFAHVRRRAKTNKGSNKLARSLMRATWAMWCQV